MAGMIEGIRDRPWPGLRPGTGGFRLDFGGGKRVSEKSAQNRARCCSECGAGL
jgi:hypothetical protein